MCIRDRLKYSIGISLLECMPLVKGFGRDLFSPLGTAISDYSLIKSNDRILMGISGGKDSLLMAWALSDIKRRSPVKFSDVYKRQLLGLYCLKYFITINRYSAARA